jgi:hypothetical protein
MVMEVETNPPINGSETFDQFDVELHLLNINMQKEVVKMIKPFLNILKVANNGIEFIMCWP